jgi:hypothetical protein
MKSFRTSLVFAALAAAAFLSLETASRASTKDYIGYLMEFSDKRATLVESKNVYCTFSARNGRQETIKQLDRFLICLDGEVVGPQVGLKIGRRYFVGDKSKLLLASSRHDGMIEGYVKSLDAGKKLLTIQGFDGKQLGARAIEVALADDAVITLDAKPAEPAAVPQDADVAVLPAGPQRVEIYTTPHAKYEPTGSGAAGFEGVVISAPENGSFTVYNRRTGQPQQIKQQRRFYYKLDGDSSGAKQVVVPGRRIVCLASRNRPHPSCFFSISSDASLVSGTLTAVNGTEAQVESPGPEGPVIRKLTVMPDAEIMLDGKPAEAAALKVGQWIRVLAPRKQEVQVRTIPYTGGKEAFLTALAKPDKHEWAKAAKALTRWTCHDPETRLPVMCELVKAAAAKEEDKRSVFEALSQGLLDVPEAVREKHADTVVEAAVTMMPTVGFHTVFCIDLMAAHPGPVAKHREAVEAIFKNNHRQRQLKRYWDQQVVPKLKSE